MSADIKFKSNKNQLIAIAAILVFFVVIAVVFKKLFEFLNTESPVLDEPSKKILSDKQLTKKYYEAIENEKNNGNARITIENEEYEIIRAGKYSEPVVSN